MQHIYNLADANLTQPSMLTIGAFDGVHLGHQTLIRSLVAEAHAAKRLAVVLTFFPHPDVVLGKVKGRFYLTTRDQRARLLNEIGVDLVVSHPFDDAVRQIRASDFVDLLVDRLRLQALWVGEDFALGYKREGNIQYLMAQGLEKGFSVHRVDFLQADQLGNRISSSQVRQFLHEGDVIKAHEWLGRPYSVEGMVVQGDQRGRVIGFPTANIDVWQEQMLPRFGVYAGWAVVQGERFMAVTNVGIRPTFAGDAPTVEAHLLNFNRDIYGERMTLTFEGFLRPEQKFSGIDALIAQLKQDVQDGRSFLLSHETT